MINTKMGKIKIGILLVIFMSLLIFASYKIVIVKSYKDTYKQTNNWMEENRGHFESFSGYTKKAEENIFYLKYKDAKDSVSNEDFFELLEGGPEDIYLLDAREDFEHEEGIFKNSIHFRFADILTGTWTEIPRDKKIYVICWTGIRGQIVSDFLRSKNIASFYLERGLESWRDFPESGKYYEMNEKYSSPNYRHLFNTKEIDEKVSEGVSVIDCRTASEFKEISVKGSVRISTILTPSNILEEVYATISSARDIILVCDDIVTCFDAKATGVELEKRGKRVLGFYKDINKYITNAN